MRGILYFILLVSLVSRAQTDYKFIDKHSDDVSCLAFSPDNTHIVSGGWDSKLIVYSNDSLYVIQQELKDFHGAVKSIAFSRDGYKMLAGGQEGKLAIYGFNDLSSWDIVGLDSFLNINNSQINKLIYGPGMRTIFIAGDDGNFITYDLTKKKILKVVTKRPISAACVSIDRRSYFIANEGSATITQYDVFGKVLRTYEGHLDNVTDILVTPNRKYLISSSKDRTIKIWNLQNGKVENTIIQHTWAVTDIELDPFGVYLVSCGLDGGVGLFSVETGDKLMFEVLPKHKCNAIAISPDLTKIAVAASMDGSESSGFYIIPTKLKARNIKLPKRYFADKKEKELYESIYEEHKEDKVEKTEVKPKPVKTPSSKEKKESKSSSEVILKKSKQVEIRMD